MELALTKELLQRIKELQKVVDANLDIMHFIETKPPSKPNFLTEEIRISPNTIIEFSTPDAGFRPPKLNSHFKHRR